MDSTVRLLQISDCHLSSRADGALRGVPTRASLDAVLGVAAGALLASDALLLTGDLVNDDTGGYAPLRARFADLGRPVLCLPGNHDDTQAMQQELDLPPFQYCGHRDLGPWRLVLLDSCVPGQAFGRLGKGELARLDAALATAGDRHVLVALHHQPLRVGSRWLDSVGLQNGDELFAVTDRHASVRAVVFGHVHQQFEAERNGVQVLGVPSTCAQFLPGAEQFAVDPAPAGCRALELRADGTLGTQVLRTSAQQAAPLLAAASG